MFKRSWNVEKDHPRVCGENLQRASPPSTSGGSPPRVRGKPLESEPHTLGVGITPACAGKTRLCPAAPTRSEDHPRVCGENEHDVASTIWNEGSPPRVRGKRRTGSRKQRKVRITPACAGKTGFLVVAAHGSKDHPRVCGENISPRSRRARPRGSPPRVRGKHSTVP